MKHLTTIALLLNLGAAGVYAQERPVRMTFSGTTSPSAINLDIPATQTSEYNLAGNSTLGAFTFRTISANGTTEQHSSTCAGPMQHYYLATIGAGVFRFQDGSLLTVDLTDGSDCVDLAKFRAHCVRTFKITGGTHRFKNATGILEFSESFIPVSVDFHHMPVFFTATGNATGTISGVAAAREEQQDEPQ